MRRRNNGFRAYTVDRMAEVEGAIFLHKPYQPSTIVETIRRLLR
jgi:hypothetical protein